MEVRNREVLEDRRIIFRVGINLGDIVVDGDDILGDGVNIAARLQGIAEPGGICPSGSAYDQVRAKLAPQVEMAEVATARRVSPNDNALHLAWRAQGLCDDALQKGQPPLMLEAIVTAEQATAADPTLLSAHWVLALSHNMSHLLPLGPGTGKGT